MNPEKPESTIGCGTGPASRPRPRAAPGPARVAPGLAAPVGSGAGILVVDDAPANLQVLAGMLKDRGYKVRPAPSGKLALLAAQRDPPDLILLDINMPEMNGYEVCERLQADRTR